jgi:hypothetical protein
MREGPEIKSIERWEWEGGRVSASAFEAVSTRDRRLPEATVSLGLMPTASSVEQTVPPSFGRHSYAVHSIMRNHAMPLTCSPTLARLHQRADGARG